jgi:hypothetical protein
LHDETEIAGGELEAECLNKELGSIQDGVKEFSVRIVGFQSTRITYSEFLDQAGNFYRMGAGFDDIFKSKGQ